MSSAPGRPMAVLLRHELEVLHGKWVWYLVLGVILIVLGMLSLTAPLVPTLATVTVISIFLIFAGITEVVGAFWAREWSGFFMLLLIGILYLVVGVLTLEQPVKFAADLTLLIAIFLIVGGIFRIASALSTHYPNWGWVLANGVITLALGVMIWRHWPETTLWVIGTFIGIELIFNGWTWVMLALALRRIPVRANAVG